MSLLGKLFGKGKGKSQEVETLVGDILQGVIGRAGLDLSFDVQVNREEERIKSIEVEMFGTDEELLKQKEGSLLDAFQLYIRRVVQHNYPDESPSVIFDTNGFRAQANQTLIELVEKLRDRALEQGKSVYLRQLPPKDRKVVHQFLADDGRVKSRSIGDGLYKKIKIYPVRKNEARATEEAQSR